MVDGTGLGRAQRPPPIKATGKGNKSNTTTKSNTNTPKNKGKHEKQKIKQTQKQQKQMCNVFRKINKIPAKIAPPITFAFVNRLPTPCLTFTGVCPRNLLGCFHIPIFRTSFVKMHHLSRTRAETTNTFCEQQQGLNEPLGLISTFLIIHQMPFLGLKPQAPGPPYRTNVRTSARCTSYTPTPPHVGTALFHQENRHAKVRFPEKSATAVNSLHT